MKLSLVQPDLLWADPQGNRDHLEDLLLRCAPGTDLVVLPEMFSTGFISDPEGVAEEGGGGTLSWMKRTAAANGYALAGSVAVREPADGTYRNRFFFVSPDGEVRHYDKRHLFSYGLEHLHFTSGTERAVVCWRGVRILLQVCYDLRFPVFSRNRLLSGRPDYDLALYVASWPATRIGAWDLLLRSRAIENQCYVAGVNRVGTDPHNRYSGHSAFIGPSGEILSVCKENEEEVSNVELDMALLQAFRQRFPVLKDADAL